MGKVIKEIENEINFDIGDALLLPLTLLALLLLSLTVLLII